MYNNVCSISFLVDFCYYSSPSISVPWLDDLADVTKESKVRWKDKNSYILGSIGVTID